MPSLCEYIPKSIQAYLWLLGENGLENTGRVDKTTDQSGKGICGARQGDVVFVAVSSVHYK